MKLLICILGMGFLLTACGHLGFERRSEGVEASNLPPSSDGNAVVQGAQASPESNANQTESGPSEKAIVADSEMAVPMDYNTKVEDWIEYFQTRGRARMEVYLERSGRYLPLMKKILRENGLPEDLVYVALIESGFSSRATSRARAVGYWQFIRGTAHRYGLKMNGIVDERRDPIKSTQAAAQYLKGLYNVFGAWYLAIAGYNSGENRIKQAVMRHYSRDFWELSAAGGFPRETSEYVPKFLAARLIAQKPEKYGFFNVNYAPAISFDEVEVTKPVHLGTLAQAMNISLDALKDLNPAMLKGIVPVMRSQSTTVRVPVGLKELAQAHLEKSFVAESKVQAAEEAEVSSYRVKPGDNLGKIARKFRISIPLLAQFNNLTRRSILSIGMMLKIPVGGGSRTINNLPPDSRRLRREEAARAERIHLVRKGDTLAHIAKKYGVSLLQLTERNRMGKRSKLMAGSRLVVPSM